MTFYTHKRFIGLRCAGCGRTLIDLMRITEWRGNVPTPVCEEADNLTILERRDAGR